LDIDGNQLDATFLDDLGGVSDTFSIVKATGVCNDKGVCEAGEDCANCPNDCVSGGGIASCGNGICEAADGEDCITCAADCRGKQNGKPSRRYCCGDGNGAGDGPVACGDNTNCASDGWQCTENPVAAYCLAGLCSDGLDCDGQIDCSNNADCGGDPACDACVQLGDGCSDDADCCSQKCKDKPGAKLCK
ncbi:MAG: hypothetical protein VYE73_00865, partial [Acidobacteriota bacterium]|nr:hypothetical protein [Acidobacteriota bacterium]